MTAEFKPDQIVDQVTETLLEAAPDADRARVRDVVARKVDALKDKPVHDYVGVLAERQAREELGITGRDAG